MEKRLETVICTLNSQYIHSSLAPWCLLAGVKEYCDKNIYAHVIEGTINEKINNVAERIILKKPNVIGFCCYIWNISETYELISLIKKSLPNTIIVLGGPEVSYNAESVLAENSLVDYIISGEGELPFALLLNSIIQENNFEKIPGIFFRSGEIIVTSPPYISNEDPPSPYTDEYFEALSRRIAYLETSRGCPYSCAFCLSGRCGNARFFNIERAKSELLSLANSGTKTVKLVDRTFNANKKRAVEIFEFIINNYGTLIPDGVCFHFEIAGDILESDTINLLATAPEGAIQLEIGMQSFNPKTLAAINRKTNMEHLKSNIRSLVENANMHIHIDLIAGLPFEGFDSIKTSFNTAFSLKPHMLQFGFLKLLHGASMREEPEIFPCKYSESPPYEVLETPWLSIQELELLHNLEDSLDRIYNSGRFRRTLDFLLKNSGYTPFDLFMQFGNFSNARGTQKLSLDDYTSLIYEYFSKQSCIDPVELRDVMVCDRLATNSSGLIPKSLQIINPILRKIKLELNQNTATRNIKGIKRGVDLLYSDSCAVYVDYVNQNKVTGEYKLNRYYSDILNSKDNNVL